MQGCGKEGKGARQVLINSSGSATPTPMFCSLASFLQPQHTPPKAATILLRVPALLGGHDTLLHDSSMKSY